jgi:hypothetical protein
MSQALLISRLQNVKERLVEGAEPAGTNAFFTSGIQLYHFAHKIHWTTVAFLFCFPLLTSRFCVDTLTYIF